MGSGLCRRKDGKHRAMGVDGLYKKIVFNYPKQWTRCSNKCPKSDKKNTKPNKSNKKKKPIISAPYPADPDRLEGDKWRYVILTRLDTEPPPERPPRTKLRHRLHDSVGVGRRCSALRRRRSSRGRGSGRRPQRPGRRNVANSGDGHQQQRQQQQQQKHQQQKQQHQQQKQQQQQQEQQQQLSADQLMELVLKMYHHRPAGRSSAWPRARDCGQAAAEEQQRYHGPGAGTKAEETGTRDDASENWLGRDDRLAEVSGTTLQRGEKASPAAFEKPASPSVWWQCAGRGPIADKCNGLFDPHRYRRNGFFGSVGRARAMANDLLSL